ncbi:MAG: hypothetical protein Q8P21_02265 [bacterium]|nr:hypothetical protein [bacterium]
MDPEEIRDDEHVDLPDDIDPELDADKLKKKDLIDEDVTESADDIAEEELADEDEPFDDVNPI